MESDALEDRLPHFIGPKSEEGVFLIRSLMRSLGGRFNLSVRTMVDGYRYIESEDLDPAIVILHELLAETIKLKESRGAPKAS